MLPTRHATSMPRTSASISCRPLAPMMLGERQRRRGDRAGGVDDRLQVRVVEVERVRRDAVEQRRAGDVDALAAAEHRRLRRGRQLLHGGERRLGRRMPRRADRAADPVQERAVRLVLDGVAPAARRMRRDELGEDARDRRRVRASAARPWCSCGHRQSRDLDVAFLRDLRPAARCRRACTARTARASSASARALRRRAARAARDRRAAC